MPELLCCICKKAIRPKQAVLLVYDDGMTFPLPAHKACKKMEPLLAGGQGRDGQEISELVDAWLHYTAVGLKVLAAIGVVCAVIWLLGRL